MNRVTIAFLERQSHKTSYSSQTIFLLVPDSLIVNDALERIVLSNFVRPDSWWSIEDGRKK